MDDDAITFSCHDNDMHYDFIDDVDDDDFDDVNSDDFDFAHTRRHNTAPSQFNLRVNNNDNSINTNNNSEISTDFMVINGNQGTGQLDLPGTKPDSGFVGQNCDETASGAEHQQKDTFVQCSSSSSATGSTPTPTTEDVTAECRFGGSFGESRTSRNAWGNESYATIIRNAIHSKPGKKARLNEIYQFFTDRIPYFNKHKESKGWKNSVRHNLSLGKQFKRKQSSDPKEKGSFWVVDDEVQGQNCTPTRTSSMSNTSTRNMVTAKRKSSTGRDASSNLNRPVRCKSENSIGNLRTNVSSSQNQALPTGELVNGFQVAAGLQPDLNIGVLNVEPMDSCNDLDLTAHFSDLGSAEGCQGQRPRAVTTDSVPRSSFVTRNQMWVDPLVSINGVPGMDAFVQSPPMCSSNQVQHRKLHVNNKIRVSNCEQISLDDTIKTSAKHAAQHDSNFGPFSEFSTTNLFQNKPVIENVSCHQNFGVNNLNFSVNPGSTNNQGNKFGIQLPVLSQDANQNISIQQSSISNFKTDQQVNSTAKTEVSDPLNCFNPTSCGSHVANMQLFCSENNNNPYISSSNFSNSSFNEVFIGHATNTPKEGFENVNNSNFAIDPAEQMNLNSSVRTDFAHLRQNSLSEDISKINPSLNELLYDNPLSIMNGHQGNFSPIGTRSSANFPAASTATFANAEPIQRFSNMTIEEQPIHVLNTHGRPSLPLTSTFPITTSFHTHHNATTTIHNVSSAQYASAISRSANNPNTSQLPFGFATNQPNGPLSLPIALPSQPLPTSTFAFVAHT